MIRNILMASAAVVALAGAAHAESLPVAGGIGEVSWNGNGYVGHVDVDAGTFAATGTANNGIVSTYGKSVVTANTGLFTRSLFGAAAGAAALDADVAFGNGAQSGSAVAGRAVAAGDINATFGNASHVSGPNGDNPTYTTTPLFSGEVSSAAEGTFAARAGGFTNKGVSLSVTGGKTDVAVAGATAPIANGVALFDASGSAFAKNVTVGHGYAESATAAEVNVRGVSAVKN